jgi:uncharacterized membrane protein
MKRLPYAIFGALLAGATALLLATVGALPERIPTHFGLGGAPDAWMTRGRYTVFMLAFVIGLPLLMTVAVGSLPRVVPRLVNLPNRDRPLAPEQREAVFAFLGRHACWLGCIMVLLAAGVHWLIVRASRSTPPRLEEGLLVWMLGVFLVAMAAWTVVVFRRFRQVTGGMLR